MFAVLNSTKGRPLGQACPGVARVPVPAPPDVSRIMRRLICDPAGNLIGSDFGCHPRLAETERLLVLNHDLGSDVVDLGGPLSLQGGDAEILADHLAVPRSRSIPMWPPSAPRPHVTDGFMPHQVGGPPTHKDTPCRHASSS